jgi:mitochondrial fusion and transport protein UGO1
MSSSSRDGVNPLRPYYIPPTIGDAPAVPGPSGAPNPFADRVNHATSGPGYASKARDMFQDLDYNGYVGETQSSVVQNVKDLLDELLWKYTSVLMAQPFEVAKTILQARDQDINAALSSPMTPEPSMKRSSSYGSNVYDVRSCAVFFAPQPC